MMTTTKIATIITATINHIQGKTTTTLTSVTRNKEQQQTSITTRTMAAVTTIITITYVKKIDDEQSIKNFGYYSKNKCFFCSGIVLMQ